MKRFKCIRCNELEELRSMVTQARFNGPWESKWDSKAYKGSVMEDLWVEELKEVSKVRDWIRAVMPCWTGDSYWCLQSKTYKVLEALGYTFHEIMYLIDYRALEEEFASG